MCPVAAFWAGDAPLWRKYPRTRRRVGRAQKNTLQSGSLTQILPVVKENLARFSAQPLHSMPKDPRLFLPSDRFSFVYSTSVSFLCGFSARASENFVVFSTNVPLSRQVECGIMTVSEPAVFCGPRSSVAGSGTRLVLTQSARIPPSGRFVAGCTRSQSLSPAGRRAAAPNRYRPSAAPTVVKFFGPLRPPRETSALKASEWEHPAVTEITQRSGKACFS